MLALQPAGFSFRQLIPYQLNSCPLKKDFIERMTLMTLIYAEKNKLKIREN